MTEQNDVGRKAIVSGYAGSGVVLRTMGRTVEVEFPYGIVAADRDHVVIYDPR